jgi:hypothetical protein
MTAEFLNGQLSGDGPNEVALCFLKWDGLSHNLPPAGRAYELVSPPIVTNAGSPRRRFSIFGFRLILCGQLC